MVACRHGSHGGPTDSATTAATTLAWTAVNGRKWTIDDLFLTVALVAVFIIGSHGIVAFPK